MKTFTIAKEQTNFVTDSYDEFTGK